LLQFYNAYKNSIKYMKLNKKVYYKNCHKNPTNCHKIKFFPSHSQGNYFENLSQFLFLISILIKT
jgi:hypothetical protein